VGVEEEIRVCSLSDTEDPAGTLRFPEPDFPESDEAA
jgi:hypothetical protein